MKVVCVDFDGVINSYRSGFTRDGEIADEPLPGAQDAIMRLRRKYTVLVFSTRARSVEGRNAIIAWLAKYNIEVDGIVNQKPPAHVYIDDRAVCFTGDWTRCMTEVENFQTWQDIEAETREQMVSKENLQMEENDEELFMDGGSGDTVMTDLTDNLPTNPTQEKIV